VLLCNSFACHCLEKIDANEKGNHKRNQAEID
jgi:hypothetical protein